MSLSQDICYYEQPVIKQEMVDSEDVPANSSYISVLDCIKQEFATLKKEADCKITNVLISEPGGIAKFEVHPENSANKPQNVPMNDIDEPSESTKDVQINFTDSNLDNSLTCTHCSFVAVRKFGLTLHHKKAMCHKKAEHRTRMRIRCVHCGAMVCKYRYKVHLKVHSNIPLSCSKCSFTGSKHGLWKHHKQQHSESQTCKNRKSYFCTVCDLRYVSKKLLEIHKKSHLIKSSFGCASCNSFFRNPWSLEIHVKAKCMKSVEKPYQCRFCNQKFFTVEYFNWHERRKHFALMSPEELARPVLGFTCQCGKTFNFPNSLQKHKRLTHRAPERCPLCHLLFKDLKGHMVSCKLGKSSPTLRFKSVRLNREVAPEVKHESVTFQTEIEYDLHNLSQSKKAEEKAKTTFACSLCNKMYTSKYWRDVHLRRKICVEKTSTQLITSDEGMSHSQPSQLKETFNCNLCKRVFRSKYWRDIHQHKGKCEKGKKCRVSCEICFRNFSGKDSLWHHTKNSSNCNIPAGELCSDPCPGCSEKFESDIFLKRHLKYCSLIL